MNSGANKFHGFETEEQQQITENFEIARKNAYIIVQCCNGEMLRKAIDNFKIASRSIIVSIFSIDNYFKKQNNMHLMAIPFFLFLFRSFALYDINLLYRAPFFKLKIFF